MEIIEFLKDIGIDTSKEIQIEARESSYKKPKRSCGQEQSELERMVITQRGRTLFADHKQK